MGKTEDAVENHPLLKAVEPEGILVYSDSQRSRLCAEKWAAFFIEEAKRGLNEGVSFLEEGEGFMRFNSGTSKAVLHQALQQLLGVYEKRK